MRRKDEVGDLTRAIGRLQSDLRSMIGGISDSMEQLITASDTLEQTSCQIDAGMDHVMQSVGTITSGAVSPGGGYQKCIGKYYTYGKSDY